MNNLTYIVNRTSSGASRSQIEAWNKSAANIEQYMFFVFVATILMFLIQLVIVVQLQKKDVIEIFDNEGWIT